MLAEDEFITSCLTVRRFLRRFEDRQSFENLRLPGRPAEKVTPQLLDFIDAEMDKNDELTAPNPRRKINEKFQVDFSERKVKRLRSKPGWVKTRTKYCQLIREAKKGKL